MLKRLKGRKPSAHVSRVGLAAAAALALDDGIFDPPDGAANDAACGTPPEMDLAMLQSKALQDQLDQGRMVASIMMSPDSMPLKLMPKDKNMPMVHAI